MLLSDRLHVRFWPKADMGSCTAHARFRGKADIAPEAPNFVGRGCPSVQVKKMREGR